MPGGDNRIIFCIIKMKMRCPGTDIYNLEIQPSPWAVGGQFRVSGQPVSAAAADD